MDEPIIRCAGLEKRFSERRASRVVFKEVDLELAEGEILGVVGPNGSGKTTLLRTISGYLEPTRGSVTVMGGSPKRALESGRLGFMSQEPAFARELSVEEYWRCALRVAHPLTADSTALEELGLQRYWSTKLKNLSRGTVQRIAVALTLAFARKVYVFDEPTEGLDVDYRVTVRQLLLALKASGSSVLLSSHDMADIESIADRVVLLHDGTAEVMPSASREYRVEFVAPSGFLLTGLPTGVNAVRRNASIILYGVPRNKRGEMCKFIVEQGGEISEVRAESWEEIIRKRAEGVEAPSG